MLFENFDNSSFSLLRCFGFLRGDRFEIAIQCFLEGAMRPAWIFETMTLDLRFQFSRPGSRLPFCVEGSAYRLVSSCSDGSRVRCFLFPLSRKDSGHFSTQFLFHFCSTFSRKIQQKIAKGSKISDRTGTEQQRKKGQYLFYFEILALHFVGTRSEDRTRTAKGRGILSPLRLPVPPSGQDGVFIPAGPVFVKRQIRQTL